MISKGFVMSKKIKGSNRLKQKKRNRYNIYIYLLYK